MIGLTLLLVEVVIGPSLSKMSLRTGAVPQTAAAIFVMLRFFLSFTFALGRILFISLHVEGLSCFFLSHLWGGHDTSSRYVFIHFVIITSFVTLSLSFFSLSLHCLLCLLQYNVVSLSWFCVHRA